LELHAGRRERVAMAPTAEMTAQRAAGETQDHHAGIIMPRRTNRLTKKKGRLSPALVRLRLRY
jgi:hypothetical protein